MSAKRTTIQKIVNRNVERHLVKEFLMKHTNRAGFGGLDIQRSPRGTLLTIEAERPGIVIGRRGRLINELQRRVSREFDLDNPKLEVKEAEEPELNAQIMAEKLASALERGWYFRRAGHSTAQTIMEKGAKGVLITLNGKITGARHRTQKFQHGHIKHCGETALKYMDIGYSVAIRKLGTIGVTVAIMRQDTILPHEVPVLSLAEVKQREADAAAGDSGESVASEEEASE